MQWPTWVCSEQATLSEMHGILRHLEQLPIAPPMPPLDALGARLGYGLSPQVPTSPSGYVVVRGSGQLGNGRVCGGGGGGGGGEAAVSVRAKVRKLRRRPP